MIASTEWGLIASVPENWNYISDCEFRRPQLLDTQDTIRRFDGQQPGKNHPTGSFTLSPVIMVQWKMAVFEVTAIGGSQAYSKMPANEVFFRLVMLQVLHT